MVKKKYMADTIAYSVVPLLEQIQINALNFHGKFTEYNALRNEYRMKNTTYKRKTKGIKKLSAKIILWTKRFSNCKIQTQKTF